ncbi:hypothetical protein [Leucobacter chromiiresistens]|uniref:hypothetical protein n=1 Tax=Leucobacter chromiiresistens TaxID=1079994 RepID=UPI000AD81CFB|nr:hypothetical protein [Leucobacter chromiiresistens]
MSSSEPQQPHPPQAQPPQYAPPPQQQQPAQQLDPQQQQQYAQPDTRQPHLQPPVQEQHQQAPPYAQHQYGQPGAQQQYAQQQYAQQQYGQQQYAQQQYAQPGTQQRNQSATGSLNVPGIIALVLLLLTTFVPLLTPSLYRASVSSDMFYALIPLIPGTNALLLLIAGALAIVGLVVRRLTRWRWTAIGAAVAVAVGFLSLAFSWIGNLLIGMPAFY